MGYRSSTYGNKEFDRMASECGNTSPDGPGFQSHPQSTWERNKKYRKRLQRLASIAEEKQVHGKNAVYGGAICIDEDCHGPMSKPFTEGTGEAAIITDSSTGLRYRTERSGDIKGMSIAEGSTGRYSTIGGLLTDGRIKADENKK